MKWKENWTKWHWDVKVKHEWKIDTKHGKDDAPYTLQGANPIVLHGASRGAERCLARKRQRPKCRFTLTLHAREKLVSLLILDSDTPIFIYKYPLNSFWMGWKYFRGKKDCKIQLEPEIITSFTHFSSICSFMTQNTLVIVHIVHTIMSG